MNRARPALLLVLGWLALGALPADAAVYKWVDAEGRTHYSSTPPPGADARPVVIREDPVPPPAAGPPPAAPPTAGSGGGDSAPRPPDQARAAACDTARHNLALLEKDGPVAKAGPDGKNVLLEGEARARELDRARKAVAYLCD